MRVLISTVDFPPIEGGISTVAYQTALELCELGHEVTVVAPYFPGQEEFDEAQPMRVIRFRGYGLGWLRALPFLLYAWPRVRRHDVALAINIAYGGLLGLLGRVVYGVPYVTFAYAYEFMKFAHAWPLPGLLRLLYRKSCVTIAISRFTRDALESFGVARGHVALVLPGAPRPIAFEQDALNAMRHRYVLEGRRVVLAVGRFVRRKGHVTLVAALPKILAQVPDAVLVMVGQGPMLHKAARLANALGVRDHAVFPGRLSDEEVAALYAICDVFALPTGQGEGGQVEGFGLVFAEAQAYAKPVVAGRSGGVCDAVADGETGLLVDPTDADAVADAVVRVLTDSALARRLGEAGRARVARELNWAAFARRLMAEVGERR